MSYIGASSERGILVGDVLGPNSAVSPGETEKLQRVELPDSTTRYVLAGILS